MARNSLTNQNLRVVTEIFQALTVFVVSAAIVYPLMMKAEEIGLIDVPNARKVHDTAVPVVGGIAIVLGVSAGIIAFGFVKELFWLGVCSYLLMVCGMFDDKLNIRVSYRLMMQVMVGLILYLSTGTQLTSLGSIVPGLELQLGALSVPFTIFCIIGVINAVNMIDGIDGLSGSLIFITFGALSLLMTGSAEASMMHYAMAAVMGFLLYNLRVSRQKALIFMGDAGSTVIGLWIAYMLINGSQGEGAAVSPIAAAWFLGVPLLDATSVMIKRKMLNRPLFGADKGHLHHFMLDCGFSVNQAVVRLCLLQLALCGVGYWVSVERSLEPLAFWGFLALIAFTVVSTLSSQQRLSAAEEAMPESLAS